MRRLIAITHLSLDGVMQSPGGPDEDPRDGFAHGGWIMTCGDHAIGAAVAELIATEFDLLLGRRTYDIFASYWPRHGDNPIGRAFNRATKHVVTRTRRRLDWQDSHAIGDDVIDGLRRLIATPGPDLHTWGSAELMQTLIAAGLVDEHRLWIYPVLLGAGRRLFEPGLPASRLTLIESRRTPGGTLLNTYRPAGALPPPKP